MNRLHVMGSCLLIATVTAVVTSAAEEELPEVVDTSDPAYVSGQLIYDLQDRPTPQCHASTIVETDEGLVAAWFGGTHEKHTDVGIWTARHDGESWSEPTLVFDGTEGESQDWPCWNPVLFQPSSGPLMLFYKVGPSPRQWWGMLALSNDAGTSWSAPRRLGTSERLGAKNANLLGPVKNKPVQFSDGTILCPSSSEHRGWRVHFEKTTDLGKTWEVIGPINDASEFDAIQPSILVHGDDRLQILCRSRQGVIVESWSTDRGNTWSPLAATELPNPNAGTDAVTLQDGRHVLVYNHATRGGGKNGRQILNVATSGDGHQWQVRMTLENEGHPAGYSYPAVIQTDDGKVHITYTWRRQSINHVVLDPARF